MTEWLIDWLIDWLINWLTYWLTDWLIDWLTDWLIDYDWWTYWLTFCLSVCLSVYLSVCLYPPSDTIGYTLNKPPLRTFIFKTKIPDSFGRIYLVRLEWNQRHQSTVQIPWSQTFLGQPTYDDPQLCALDSPRNSWQYIYIPFAFIKTGRKEQANEMDKQAIWDLSICDWA